MKRFVLMFSLTLMLALAGCGGASQSSNFSGQPAVFVTGEDAPVSSVVAFNITIDKITLNTGSGAGASSVTVLSTPTAVDF